MAENPTEESAAYYILDIFVKQHGLRAGEVLGTRKFLLPFNRTPWRSKDFTGGMRYAAERGWIEVLSGMASFRLTELGFASAGADKMNLASECNERVTIERTDGTRYEDVPSLVTADMIFIPDAKLPVAPNDVVLRELPSGLVERLVVIDPGFHAQFHGISAHYQAKYRREGQGAAGTPGYVIHVSGNNARVNIQSTDNSTNVIYQNVDLSSLAQELTRLREVLLQKATDAEHYSAIGSIASAETAAKNGQSSGVQKALSALGSAGKWVLGVTKDIGVQSAVALLKVHMGLPPG